jgi:hypothetical protein
VLLAFRADQADRAEADLFIDAGTVAIPRSGSIAVNRWDTSSPDEENGAKEPTLDPIGENVSIK